MGDEQYTIYLHELRHRALAIVLQTEGISVEDMAQQLLEDYYRQVVPENVQRHINKAIRIERQSASEAAALARRFAALRVTENGQTMLFEHEGYGGPAHMGLMCRRYLWEHQGKDGILFAATLDGLVSIDATQFFDHWDAITEDNNTLAVVDIDFDSGTLGYMLKDGGMRTYPMQAVSVAAYKAFRKSHTSRDKQDALFCEALSGKEMTFGEDGLAPARDFPQEQSMG